MYVIQRKSGIIVGVGMSVKNQIIGVIAKMIMCGILVQVILNAIKHKIDGCLDIKKCFCKKRLFGKLVLACQDEILNTTENATL